LPINQVPVNGILSYKIIESIGKIKAQPFNDMPPSRNDNAIWLLVD